MNTPTNTPPSKSKIRLQLDKESLNTRIELGSLLRSFGAPTALAQAAASAWKTDLLIEKDPESGSALYYLSIVLVADFIDLILGQLSADSRAQAMQFRDASRALEASANELSRLKQTKPQAYDAMQQWLKSDEARHLVHKILSGQHQRPPATSPNHAAPRGQ